MYLAVLGAASSLLLLISNRKTPSTPEPLNPDPINTTRIPASTDKAVISYWFETINTYESADPDTQAQVNTKHFTTDPLAIDQPWNQNAIQWLLSAQSSDGGWGAGSHAYQQIRDPHEVQTDPATTAFAAMALLKAGGTLEKIHIKKKFSKHWTGC